MSSTPPTPPTPPGRPRLGPRTVRPGTARSRSGLAALACLAAVAAMVGTLAAPSPVRPPTTGSEFSAATAREHLDHLARGPRPTGSPAHERVRQHLVGELDALGLEVDAVGPQLAAATDHLPGVDVTSAAWTQNLVGRAPGRRGGGTVVLLAHYDSVRNSPGASDNGYGVAATLEVARALLADGSHRNQLVVLLSDAEEIGLLGARALIESQQLDPSTTVVLNQEARGSSGTTQLVRAHADAATAGAVARGPRALGGSEIASLFANATELDALAPAGFRVLDLASSGTSAAYDSGADDLGGVDQGALQQRGDLVLATARRLLSADLTRPWQPQDLTWFAVPGTLVVLPPGVVPGCLLAALAMAGGSVVVRLRRGHDRRSAVPGLGVGSPLHRSRGRSQDRPPGRAPVAAAAVVATGTVGALAVTGWWRLLVVIRPGYGSFAFEDTPRPWWHQVTVLAIAGLISTLVHVSLSRRLGRGALVHGHLLVLTAAGAVAVLVLPGAAHLFVLPATVGHTLLLVGTVLGRPLLTGAWLAPYAIAVAVLLLPAADVGAAGLGQAWLPAVAVVLISWPLLAALPRGRVRLRAGLVLLLAVTVPGSALLGLQTDRIEPGHPRHTSLALVQAAGAPSGTWVSTAEDRWARGFTPRRSGPSGWAPDPLLGLHLPVRTGPGPEVDRAPPGLVRGTPAGDGSRVRVGVTAPSSDRIALHLEGPARFVAVDDRPLPEPATPETDQFVHLTPLPDPGARAEVTVELDPGGPVHLHALGLATGLDPVPGYRQPPPEATWAPGPLNNVTAVGSRLVLRGG